MFVQPTASSSSNGVNGTSMSTGGTTVYPPQPYGPGQQTITVAQPSASVSTTATSSSATINSSASSTQAPQPSPSLKTNAQLHNTSNNSNGIVANGEVVASIDGSGASTPRKRAASGSPGGGNGDAKEKKLRADGGDETAANTAANASTSTSGVPRAAATNANNRTSNGIASTSSSTAAAAATTAPGSTGSETRQWGEEASKLDVYVWDYLTRRGFNRTAKSLMNEASMSEAPDVPLKTPQGLLFEYWAIFWDVFAARSGRGSAEATAYYEMQESRQTQKLAEQNRRADAMEKLASAQSDVASASQGRFPPVLMGAQKDAVQAATTAAQLAGQAQQRTTVNGQQTPTTQAQALLPPQQQPHPQQAAVPQNAQQQATMQQNVRPPTPGAANQQEAMANWNNAPNALQQQTQMLLLAAQRQNIPIEELRNMNPAMRTALIQSVAASNAGQAGVASQSVRPGNASAPFDAAMQQRLQQQQQQQALQRQMQQQRNPSQPNIRPGMPAPQNSVGTPGTPIGMPAQPVAQQQQGQQGGAGAQGMAAQGPQNMAAVSQGQPNRPMPGNGMAGTNDGQAHPRLTPEQQQMLVSQHQSLQQTLRQELYQAQHAPTPPMAERSFQNAQQIQMRLAQLSALLKAQPALQAQQQPNVFAQQQTNQMQAAQQQQQAQQQQPQPVGMVRPMQQAGAAGGMQGLPPGFPAGLTPQQQQQFMARRAAQQAGRPLPPDANMMMNNPGVGQPRPHQSMQQGQQGLQPFGAGNNGMSFDGQQAPQQQHHHGTPQQQLGTPQQQHGTPQHQPGGTPGPDNQQRTPFAFANPFAAGAGGQRPGGAGHGQQDDGSAQHASPFQHPQQPGAAAFAQRPGIAPQRMPSGMGPPGQHHMSSPSPRLGQNTLMGGDTSLNGSPAQIPSTPKTANAPTPQQQGHAANDAAAAAAKKKKDTASRSRKNSKPSGSMTKTPVLGAVSTPAAQAATPASSSVPTPGKDHGAPLHRHANTSDSTVNASGLNPASSSINPMLGGVSGGGSFDLTGQGNANNDQHANPSNPNANLPSSTTNNDGSNTAADDFSQMFNSGDMSQFLTDFDFPTGSFGSGDGGGLGSFGDAWDGSSMGNLFGESS